jgi:hypothetical protein
MSGTFTFRSSETHMRFIHFCVINELKTSNLLFSLKKIIEVKYLHFVLRTRLFYFICFLDYFISQMPDAFYR